MAAELKNVVLDEISVVDRPANQGARVVMLKMLEGARGMLRESGPKEARATMTKTEKVGVADRLLKVLGITKSDLDQVQGEQHTMTPADVQKVADLEKAVSDKDAEVTKLQGELDTIKAAEKQATLEKADLAKELQATQAAAATLEKRLAKIEDEGEVAKLTADLKGVAGIVDVPKMVGVIRTLQKTDAAAAEALIGELKAGASRVDAAKLFGEIGKNGAGARTDADAKIDAATAEYRKANPGTTEAAAMAAVLKAQPDLYTQHLAERQ